MTQPLQTICVFCGSSSGSHPKYLETARQLGRVLAERRIGLVYGGARLGLMGAIADSTLEAGGNVTGVIPRSMVDREIAHTGLTELHVVQSMHQRKQMMTDLSSGFIALPGGFGTLEEFCEVVTWAQLGIHQKPCGLLNVNGYYDGFLGMLRRGVEDGSMKQVHCDAVLAGDEPTILLDQMRDFRPFLTPKWIDPSET